MLICNLKISSFATINLFLLPLATSAMRGGDDRTANTDYANSCTFFPLLGGKLFPSGKHHKLDTGAA
jgi:hypothetical protein